MNNDVKHYLVRPDIDQKIFDTYGFEKYLEYLKEKKYRYYSSGDPCQKEKELIKSTHQEVKLLTQNQSIGEKNLKKN